MPVATWKELSNASSIDTIPDDQTSEAGRVDSFEYSNWPHKDPLFGAKLAKAGFYYTNQADTVKCFVCNLKMAGWQPDEDEPWQRHVEAAPGCLFAKLAKEEAQLTVEQWLDVFCARACNAINAKIDQLNKAIAAMQ